MYFWGYLFSFRGARAWGCLLGSHFGEFRGVEGFRVPIFGVRVMEGTPKGTFRGAEGLGSSPFLGCRRRLGAG